MASPPHDSTRDRHDPFVALTTVLHQEAAILDDLIFRLVKMELLIEAREARFLGLAIDEIDDRAAELGEVELARALAATDAADAVGLGDDASLSDLVAHAEPALRGVLGDLQNRLRALSDEVEQITHRGAVTLRARIDEARAAIDATQMLDVEGDYVLGIRDALGEFDDLVVDSWRRCGSRLW